MYSTRFCDKRIVGHPVGETRFPVHPVFTQGCGIQFCWTKKCKPYLFFEGGGGRNTIAWINAKYFVIIQLLVTLCRWDEISWTPCGSSQGAHHTAPLLFIFHFSNYPHQWIYLNFKKMQNLKNKPILNRDKKCIALNTAPPFKRPLK